MLYGCVIAVDCGIGGIDVGGIILCDCVFVVGDGSGGIGIKESIFVVFGVDGCIGDKFFTGGRIS